MNGAGVRAPRVGVLSLQGDFACHRASLEALGVEAVRVTLPRDLEGLDALVMPGGESTTMLRLIEANGLRAPLEAFVRAKPTMGTCAGVILLGSGGEHLPFPPLAVMDVQVERNAYGRQIDSFCETLDVPVLAGPFPGVFIRAPRITRVGEGVEVIARRTEATEGSGAAQSARAVSPGARAPSAGEPVGVRSGRIVGLCFHPELTSDLRLHRWFLRDVAGLALPEAAPSPPSRAGAEAR